MKLSNAGSPSWVVATGTHDTAIRAGIRRPARVLCAQEIGEFADTYEVKSVVRPCRAE